MGVSVLFIVFANAAVIAAQPEIPRTGPNDSREALAGRFSIDEANAFVDIASQVWEQENGCVSCHTNGMSMLTRSALGPSEALDASMRFSRQYLDSYLVDGKAPSGQHGAIEGLVATTAFLAIAESNLGKPPSDSTRRGFDRIWSAQSDSGVWTDWLKCNWPPYESDDHFGATLVAMATGGLPAEMLGSPLASAGLDRLTTYLRTTDPTNLHQRLMLVWASTRLAGILEPSARNATIAELLEAQHENGGWSMASLADESWRHDSRRPQETEAGAYATAFAVVVLDAAGEEQAAADRGRAWLRANQRESGRWFNRSPRRDRHHYISHAASALAVLALREDRDAPDTP